MSIILDGGGDFLGPDSLFMYTSHNITDFSTQTITVPFSNQDLTFGNLAYATIPKKDDVIKSIYLKSVLGPLYQSGNPAGYCHTLVSDTNIWDATGTTLLASATNVLGFYNTQLLLEWVWTSNSSITVTATNIFSFTGLGAISFKSETAAAFWGFDITYGYVFPSAVPTLNLIQSGWTTGFQPPPPNYSYYDSVGDLLVNTATLYIGGQTIQNISAKTLMIEDDIDTPLENQAGLTITVGRNDTSTSLAPRTYWTRLDFDPVPIRSLYDQTVQVAVQFEQFQNLTNRSLNGGLLNASAYTWINAFYYYSSSTISYGNLLLSIIGLYSFGSNNYFLNVYNEDTNISTTYPQYLNIGTICTSNNLVYVCTSNNELAYYSNNFTTYTIIGSIPITVAKMFPISFYIYIVAEDDMIVYDTRTGTYFHQTNPDGSPYTLAQYLQSIGIPLTRRNILAERGNLVGKYLYFPLADASRLIRVDTNLLLGNVLPGTFENMTTSFADSSVSSVDNKYMYFLYTRIDVDLGYFTRIDTTKPFNNSYIEYSYVYPNSPGGRDFGLILPLCFDGKYIYYLCCNSESANSGLLFYNTFMGFNDPKAWSWIIFNIDGITTINSLGQTGTSISKYNSGNNVYINSSSKYVYLTTNRSEITDLTRLDPYQVIPSLQSQLIVEYAKLEEKPVLWLANPRLQDLASRLHRNLHRAPASSVSLINQNQTNTFTIRAGLISDIFSLTFSGPIREFWIQTGAQIQRVVLELNGEVLVDEDSVSLGVLRPFLNHRITPSHQLYTYSIAIDPTTIEPSGTLNISRIRLTTLNIFLTQRYLTDQTVIVYSRAVNVLNCKNGIGGIMFN